MLAKAAVSTLGSFHVSSKLEGKVARAEVCGTADGTAVSQYEWRKGSIVHEPKKVESIALTKGPCVSRCAE